MLNKMTDHDMSSCSTRRHVALFNEKMCLHCGTRRRVIFFNNGKRCLPAQRGDMSSGATRAHVYSSTSRHVVLRNEKTSHVAQQEDMSLFSARQHVSSFFNLKTCVSLLDLRKCPLVEQAADMSARTTRRHVFLLKPEYASSCPTRKHVSCPICFPAEPEHMSSC